MGVDSRKRTNEGHDRPESVALERAAEAFILEERSGRYE
jgi:hypothetical protein